MLFVGATFTFSGTHEVSPIGLINNQDPATSWYLPPSLPPSTPSSPSSHPSHPLYILLLLYLCCFSGRGRE